MSFLFWKGGPSIWSWILMKWLELKSVGCQNPFYQQVIGVFWTQITNMWATQIWNSKKIRKFLNLEWHDLEDIIYNTFDTSQLLLLEVHLWNVLNDFPTRYSVVFQKWTINHVHFQLHPKIQSASTKPIKISNDTFPWQIYLEDTQQICCQNWLVFTNAMQHCPLWTRWPHQRDMCSMKVQKIGKLNWNQLRYALSSTYTWQNLEWGLHIFDTSMVWIFGVLVVNTTLHLYTI